MRQKEIEINLINLNNNIRKLQEINSRLINELNLKNEHFLSSFPILCKLLI